MKTGPVSDDTINGNANSGKTEGAGGSVTAGKMAPVVAMPSVSGVIVKTAVTGLTSASGSVTGTLTFGVGTCIASNGTA